MKSNKYIQVYLERRHNSTLYDQLPEAIKNTVYTNIVVVPAYKESYVDLKAMIDSLVVAAAAIDSEILVLILINYKAKDPNTIIQSSVKLYHQLTEQRHTTNNIVIHPLITVLDGKHAGVGMARKLLMDTAFSIFLNAKIEGIIINLDADTTVKHNYFAEVDHFFEKRKDVEAASIQFHHRLGKSDVNTLAGLQYELHLRYMLAMQRMIALPYAYHTIGSAMAVRSNAYAKEGGMVLNQAGEDFYFMHKYTKNWRLADITQTMVYPSSRSSDRVPFGTGKAITDQLSSADDQFYSYDPKSYLELEKWLKVVINTLITGSEYSYENKRINQWLVESNFDKLLSTKLLNQSKVFNRIKMFYRWFDAFKLIKYLHHMEDFYPRIPLLDCLNDISENIGIVYSNDYAALNNQLIELENNLDYNTQWSADLSSRLSKTTAS